MSWRWHEGSHSQGQYYNPYYGSSGGGGYNGGGTFGSSQDGGFGPLSQFAGFDLDTARRLRFVHGVLASLAFVVFFPVGAISIRIIPGRFALFVHAIFQILAFLLYTVAFGLGIWLVQEVRFGSFNLLNNAHPVIGIVVWVFLFFQPALGILHHLGFRRHGRRTLISHAHIWIGRIVITLGIINGGLGLQLANNTRSGEIIYGVVAGIFWLIWMIAACFGEVRRLSGDRRRSEKDYSARSSPRGSARSRDIDPVNDIPRDIPRSPTPAARGSGKTVGDSYA